MTPKAKLRNASDELLAAAQAFAGAKYAKTMRHAEKAKELSPRSPTVRELLGLAAYRANRWKEALHELRAFRRMTGEPTHLPVEMDVLRALDRPDDVESAYALLKRLGGPRPVRDEGKVVFASFLLDRDEDRRAWEVLQPVRISNEAGESEHRVWYVAARAAARLGDMKAARRLYEAIERADPAFPALDELDRATRS